MSDKDTSKKVAALLESLQSLLERSPGIPAEEIAALLSSDQTGTMRGNASFGVFSELVTELFGIAATLDCLNEFKEAVRIFATELAAAALVNRSIMAKAIQTAMLPVLAKTRVYHYICTVCSHPGVSHCSRCWSNDVHGQVSVIAGGTSELRMVYDLFFERTVVTSWASLMKKWSPQLRYGAVFTHARPMVTFSGTASRCELADLLLIFTDQVNHKRSAVLLQAKKSGGSWPPTSAGGNQWTLYTTWPSFSYNPNSRSATPGTQTRALPFAGGPDVAAQYLELDATAPSANALEAHSAHSTKNLDILFHHLLNGGSGRSVSYTDPNVTGSGSYDDWDYLIWDLLNYTWNQVMPATASKLPTGGTRGVGTFLYGPGIVADDNDGNGFSPNLLLEKSGRRVGGPGHPEGVNRGDESFPWGIPIVHLIQGEVEQ